MLKTGRRLLLAAAALGLSACSQTGQSTAPVQASSGSGVTAAGFRLPEGTGCAGEVARFRAVMANDLATGHVGRAVHDRAMGEIDRAASACGAGREAEATRMIAASKARFGYI